jgi:hypothetical protein
MLYVGLDIHDRRIAICVLGEAGTRGRIPRSDVAHRVAAVLNGSDRIPSHGAPPRRMTPKGCLGSPAIVSLRS